jgi:para-aminobenzoate synthetase/4-amino-4-deoxychorismate lyase
MIVDLLRNDLGRIAPAGGVTWSDVFDLERYETVWQLTSTVEATLATGSGLVDVFRALFPCGSVTGAPKVSTMRIITDLEDSPRGVYCGAVGFLAPHGSGFPTARFNVAIRTVVVDTETGVAEYGVGGGITWDSRAPAEFDETVAKAQVLTTRRPRFELFETMRHEPGTGFLHLDRHLRRLAGSAAYFGFTLDEREAVTALAREAARFPDRPARIRLTLYQDGRVETGGVAVAHHPDVVRVALDTGDPVDPVDPTLFHKTTRREIYRSAMARHPGADDVLLTNLRGEVTESTVANLIVRVGGRWYTPALESGLLAGIGREVALEEGWLEERVITVAELAGAEAIELLSDNRGRRTVELAKG